LPLGYIRFNFSPSECIHLAKDFSGEWRGRWIISMKERMWKKVMGNNNNKNNNNNNNNNKK
jgi:hypothetical protein